MQPAALIPLFLIVLISLTAPISARFFYGGQGSHVKVGYLFFSKNIQLSRLKARRKRSSDYNGVKQILSHLRFTRITVYRIAIPYSVDDPGERIYGTALRLAMINSLFILLFSRTKELRILDEPYVYDPDIFPDTVHFDISVYASFYRVVLLYCSLLYEKLKRSKKKDNVGKQNERDNTFLSRGNKERN